MVVENGLVGNNIGFCHIYQITVQHNCNHPFILLSSEYAFLKDFLAKKAVEEEEAFFSANYDHGDSDNVRNLKLFYFKPFPYSWVDPL